MLFIRWLAEQGIWAAPLAGFVIFFCTPKQDRRFGPTALVCALAALFFVNLTGQYPGPARVSCTFVSGLSPVCVERSVGSERAPIGRDTDVRRSM
jgi:hypothetical protein